MNRLFTLALVSLLALAGATFAPTIAEEEKKADGGNPMVVMTTSMGDIEIELFAQEAPISVENFLKYVDDGFFDGTIFHRVIKGFMIQGGGFDAQMTKKETGDPIENEAKNGLSNKVGTLAMARTNVVDSATAQFFINTANNRRLDHQSDSNYGYAVFGKVTAGMDVVRKIEGAKTGIKGRYRDVPTETITIESVRRK